MKKISGRDFNGNNLRPAATSPQGTAFTDVRRTAMKRYLLIGAFGLAALTGCGDYRYGYYAPGPPPAVRAEYYGNPPSPGHVWVNGYWGYSGNRYAWNNGYWARPPHRNARWTPGRWDRDGRGYRYHKGYWR